MKKNLNQSSFKSIYFYVSELLNNLIGQQNAKKGMSKIFDALQNRTFNKQLLYVSTLFLLNCEISIGYI